SRSNHLGPFGYGWSFNYDVTAKPDGHGNLLVTDPDGFVSTFSKAGLKSEAVKAHVVRDIVTAMREEAVAANKTLDEGHIREQLLADPAYLEDMAGRYATGEKAGAGLYW